ncbi:enoyl-CoA hydratase-related protein [Rhodococcus pyridinivorans]|uniref:enoyl-CoA hydratase/isomerase family protein n=1 Tax=Rhodococcus pyridinivorans TaxID=103816 RepID=UPI002226B041|nr:enoyl-CoA hydratase-related protein [Rhodococcus pyridinivorans]MCW3472854.1 enoyl-CoA hydratase-related protein [Rhodococcus pyridinivorans]
MNPDRCSLTIEGGIAQLRLTRLNARNAIDPAMVAAIAVAAERVAADPTVRCLLIAADGPDFCVGGDLKHFASNLDRLSPELEVMITQWHRTLALLDELPFPVVTAVQGGTAGGGLGLLWCADHVVAGESTKMATGFADIGLSGDGGSSWHLPRLVGIRRAKELILENRVIDARTALEWGIVNQVVADDTIADLALDKARALAARSITATRRMKALLNASGQSTYREQLAAELDAIVECGAGEDSRVGIISFVERRPAQFTGR